MLDAQTTSIEASDHPTSPNLVTESLLLSPLPTMLTETEPPFKICAVNSAWTNLCGFTEQEAVGKTADILQGPMTNRNRAASLAANLQTHGRAKTTLTNQTKDGQAFTHTIHAMRVFDDGREVFAARSSNVRVYDGSSVRRNGISGVLIFIVLALCPTLLVVPPSHLIVTRAHGENGSQKAPFRSITYGMRTALLHPTRPLTFNNTTLKEAPKRKHNRAERVARGLRKFLTRAAPFGGFIAAAGLSNLDMLLFFSGTAAISKF